MEQRIPSRIVIFCLPGIGDAILFTPSLALLRRAFPSAHIAAVTMFRGTADILATNPDLNEVRQYDFFHAKRLDGIRYVLGLRREGFDLSIMPFPSNRLDYNVVNRIVGRHWRAAHRYQHQSRQNLSCLNNITVAEDGHLHNVEENLRLVRAICRRVGVEVPDTSPARPADTRLKLVLTDDDRRYAEEFLAHHGIGSGSVLFGFHTYSSTFKNMHRKCWDKDNFVTLIQQLGQHHPAAHCLIFSGPADEAVNDHIMQHVNGRVSLVAESNLRRALAILQHCAMFICNDAALMHLAAALDVPVLALFGPTDWRRLHPWTEQHTIIRKDLPCMPCFYYSSRPLRCVANIDFACMREISVDEVFASVQNLLAHAKAKPVAARQ